MGSKPAKEMKAKKKYEAYDIIGKIEASGMKRKREASPIQEQSSLLDPKLTT